jgi:hypothetical protein
MYVAPDRDLLAWATQYLLASPGAIGMRDGRALPHHELPGIAHQPAAAGAVVPATVGVSTPASHRRAAKGRYRHGPGSFRVSLSHIIWFIPARRSTQSCGGPCLIVRQKR